MPERLGKLSSIPKRIGRPIKYAHHAPGFNKSGKAGRYLYY